VFGLYELVPRVRFDSVTRVTRLYKESHGMSVKDTWKTKTLGYNMQDQ